MSLKIQLLFIICFALSSCKTETEVQKYARHYQTHKDYESLNKVLSFIELGSDTALVRQILGEPIDMGFDFRYLIDSTGPQGCAMGAVFHIDDAGKIDQKWLDEICE
jgi:hypothetical protein